MSEQIGLLSFLERSDFIAQSVALLLLALSLASWWVIAARMVAQLRLNRCRGRIFISFWSAPSLDQALAQIQMDDRSGLFFGLAETAASAAEMQARHLEQGIGSGVSNSELLTRAMRNYIIHAQARIESGLTFLASVGSTAPFIGLFGTVWGIYHALVGLAGATHVVLDKVAGPVGEALIMTAAGLFVAIPAVLAYNALNRANRLILAQLDGFAHDLHAFLMTGARVNSMPKGL